MPNSIKNEKQKAETEKQKEIQIEYPPKDFDIKDDYQLKRAVEILKNGKYKQLLSDAHKTSEQ